jgi:hypothetical protein
MIPLPYELAERNVHQTVKPVLIRRHKVNVYIAQA